MGRNAAVGVTATHMQGDRLRTSENKPQQAWVWCVGFDIEVSRASTEYAPIDALIKAVEQDTLGSIRCTRNAVRAPRSLNGRDLLAEAMGDAVHQREGIMALKQNKSNKTAIKRRYLYNLLICTSPHHHRNTTRKASNLNKNRKTSNK